MKIERISENQIRCTLNKADLADRELLLNELAYGTDKAKALFRDMMQKASYELGFEAEDIPLMIEAIPVSPDCLILVITKVDDPEELDTRFSKFSKPNDYDDDDDDDDEELLDGAHNIMDLLNEIDSEIDNLSVADELTINSNAPKTAELNKTISSDSPKKANEEAPIDIYKIYTFDSLADVTRVAILLNTIYQGENTLYKDEINTAYYLVIHKSDSTPVLYNKVCNILSEYGKKTKNTYATISYMEEHYRLVIKDNALDILSVM